MIVLNTYQLKTVNYWGNPGGGSYTTPCEIVQHKAETTTPEETELLNGGYCPKCKGVLAGEGNIFCVQDQIYWQKGEGS